VQACNSLQTDNYASTPSQIFTGRMPFLPPNQQRQSTIHAPKIEVYGQYHPLNGEWQQRDPQKAHAYAENIM